MSDNYRDGGQPPPLPNRDMQLQQSQQGPVVLIPVSGGYIATAIRAVPIQEDGRISAGSDSTDSAISMRRKDPGKHLHIRTKKQIFIKMFVKS